MKHLRKRKKKVFSARVVHQSGGIVIVRVGDGGAGWEGRVNYFSG